jgi:O-antigen ligase
MPYLLALYFLSFFFLSRLNIKLAVLFLIFILPTYLIRFSILSIPTTLLELSILIVAINWIFDNRKRIFFLIKAKKKDKKPYPFSWEIILLLLISFSSVFVSGLSFSALGIFKAYFLWPVLLYILVVNNLRGEKGFRQAVVALSFSALIISLAAIWQKITGDFIPNEFWADADKRRVSSFFSYPNALALYLGPIIPLLVGLFFRQLKSKHNLKLFLIQLLLFFSALLSFLAVYFSKSKGALVALLLSFLFLGFVFLKKKIRIIILILFFLIIPTFIFYQKDYIDLKMSSSLSWQIRQAQWIDTWEMLKDGNFLWGSGLANYQDKMKDYHREGIFFNRDADPDFRRKIVIFDDEYRQKKWQPVEIYLYPHNIFLNFWTELGLAGMILFSFIIFKFLFLSFKNYLKNNSKSKKYLFLSLFFSMFVILLHGLVDVPYFKNDLAAFFFLLVSFWAILILDENSSKA